MISRELIQNTKEFYLIYPKPLSKRWKPVMHKLGGSWWTNRNCWLIKKKDISYGDLRAAVELILEAIANEYTEENPTLNPEIEKLVRIGLEEAKVGKNHQTIEEAAKKLSEIDFSNWDFKFQLVK